MKELVPTTSRRSRRGRCCSLSKALPDDAEAGGGLLVAVVQLAIALGAAAGGWVFDASGYQATFSLSAGILFVAALVAFAAWLGVARSRLLTTEG
jgi:predicted MFS family arabinose efflux permease